MILASNSIVQKKISATEERRFLIDTYFIVWKNFLEITEATLLEKPPE